MRNINKKIGNEEALLEDNENFLSLEDIAEEELPMKENDINMGVNRDFFYKVFNDYFNYVYADKVEFEIAKKFYGVGQESRNVPELAEEYSLTKKKIKEIVMKPTSPRYKNSAKHAFILLNSPDFLKYDSNKIKRLGEELDK